MSAAHVLTPEMRAEIETALLRGDGRGIIARQLGIGEWAVRRVQHALQKRGVKLERLRPGPIPPGGRQPACASAQREPPPLPAGAQPEWSRGAVIHRAFGCSHYQRCLDRAAALAWPSWSCAHCPLADETTRIVRARGE